MHTVACQHIEHNFHYLRRSWSLIVLQVNVFAWSPPHGRVIYLKVVMPAQKPFPSSVVVIGAGVFGLSTALAIAKRHPHVSVTVVDRMTPPVIDGSSVDTTRCIRTGKEEWRH
jgi:hypothetical protein